MGLNLDLEKQLVFYGSYHHNAYGTAMLTSKNKVNVGIHMIFVPLILFTFFQLGTNSPPVADLPEALQLKYLPLNVGTISALTYTTLYILLEPVVGFILTPVLLGITAFMNYLTMTYGVTVTIYAIILHVSSWIMQFIGHGAFEGRAPALLDNLFQALFLAPLFVVLEVFFFLGYRPELHRRVEVGVQKKIAEFKAGKAQ